MTIGQRLTQYRTEAKMTIDQLAEASGIPKSTINHIISGDTRSPSWDSIRALARALHKRPDDFDEDAPPPFTARELELLRQFRALDAHGRQVVELVLRAEYQRAAEETCPPAASMVTLRRYLTPVSAGTGAVLLEDSRTEALPCAGNAYTKRAHYVVSVRGDSMLPAYSDGDLLLVCRGEVGFGQVGIFCMDGMGYLKQRGRDELISLNPSYPPIPMTEGITCAGRVIGILDPAWVIV